MRHTILARFGKLGVLLCALALALTACEDQQQEPTGLELEEKEIERENGQIEEAEIEVEREELDEIDEPVGEEMAGALRQGEEEAGELGQMEDDQMQQGQQQGQEQDIAAVMVAPVDFIGAPVKGTATVADVVSDRGFWVTDGQNRLFAVVREYDEKIDINEGQRIELTGIMMAPGDPSDIEGKLEAETKKIADEQNKLVVASWKDIKILDEKGQVGGGPTEGQQDTQQQDDQMNQQNDQMNQQNDSQQNQMDQEGSSY